MIRSIDVEDLNKALESQKSINLLDVRRKEDYEASPQKIIGAKWLDPLHFDTWINGQEHNQTTIVYCVKGGAVSQSIAEKMQERGYDTSYLKGGIKAWSENGG
ncbi:MAG TPA: sulfurtransferase [Desulfobacteraceae bacterium]|nr:sulfurtransferase [Desulfobacteraceae bacterium]|tara:strand:- start:272 stop:580 length:309 start_codon:yes stop_codon:yes gene_type:complete